MRAYYAVLTCFGVLTAVAILLQADLLATLLTGGFSRLLVVVIAARAVLAGVQDAVVGRFAARTKSLLRKRILSAETDRAGEEATLATKGIDAADPYLTGYLAALVTAVVVPVAVIARLYTADLASALIVTETVPLIPVFTMLVGAHTKAKAARQWRLLTKLGVHFLDVVGV